MVAGFLNDLYRSAKDGGQLFAQQDEHDAIQAKLHGVPDGLALHTGGGQCIARELGIAHGDARSDSGQNARGLQLLGQKIGSKGQQQAEQDFCPWLFTPAAYKEIAQQQQGACRHDAHG